MKIGGHIVTPERLELLRELWFRPGLTLYEVARQLGVNHGSLFAMKAEAARQGITLPRHGPNRKPARCMSPQWQALSDKEASEWLRGDELRCPRCLLLVPCAPCLPAVGAALLASRREA